MSLPYDNVDHEFVTNLTKLFANGESSDFTIACGGDEYKVHRIVLGLHYKFFARLFKSDFQENRQNRIDLVDYLARLVCCMIQYFYEFGYNFNIDDCCPQEMSDEQLARDGCPARTGQQRGITHALLAHSWVYQLGDKYDIPRLRMLAKLNFQMLGKSIGRPESNQPELMEDVNEFLEAVSYVYENTAPNEIGLRSSIVGIWRRASMAMKKLTGRERLQELLEKYPEFGVDMMMGQGSKEGESD